MTEAEMLAALASRSDSDSDSDVGGGSIVAPAATEQQVNLVRLQDGIPIYLWRRSISFLTVREQAVSVRGMSRFFRECSDVYMQNFWSEPILHIPQDASSLESLMEMSQRLTEQEGYVEGTTVVIVLSSGVHEVVGSWEDPEDGEVMQKTLSVPCDNLSIVGQGEGETIVDGGFVVMNGRKASFEGLTVKGSSGCGVIASGAGTKILLKNVTVEQCEDYGVYAYDGAEFFATDCQFHQNGSCGVSVFGSTTSVGSTTPTWFQDCLPTHAHLTNCTSHHNKQDGVSAEYGAVVDLMGEGTSVHDNESDGLFASGFADCGRTTINVYQPCVLNDMSHGNKNQNINMESGGIVQQKDSK